MLSVQSHVVRGYVGNKSATFPLQVRNEYVYVTCWGFAMYARSTTLNEWPGYMLRKRRYSIQGLGKIRKTG